MFTRALKISALAIALGAAAGGALAQNAAPANRLALVVGEAAYSGNALPTASADAALVAGELTGFGFDVTELHDLGAADLAAQYNAFLAKVAAAPPGAAVTVYLAGLGVNVGCDDFLLPVDARIASEADVPRVSLSMTPGDERGSRADAVATSPGDARWRAAGSRLGQRRLLPARSDPAASSGSERPLASRPKSTTMRSPPKPGDANDAYAVAFATAAQDSADPTSSASCASTHCCASGDGRRADAGGRRPNPSEPPFTFPLGATTAQIQAAVATLPDSTTRDRQPRPRQRLLGCGVAQFHFRLSGLSCRLWRPIAAPDRTAADRATGAVAATAQPRVPRRARRRPRRRSSLAPVAPRASTLRTATTNLGHCAPLRAPPVQVCPPGFASIPTAQGLACAPYLPPPVLICPPRFRPFEGRYCGPDVPPAFCPPGFRPIWRDGVMSCVRNGPPPPICPIGTHPVWNGASHVCGGNPPPPPLCRDGRSNWQNGQWACLPAPPSLCPAGQTREWNNGKIVQRRLSGHRPDRRPARRASSRADRAAQPVFRSARPGRGRRWRRRSSSRCRPRRQPERGRRS